MRIKVDDPRYNGYQEAQEKYFNGENLKPGYISSQFSLGGYGKALYELEPTFSTRRTGYVSGGRRGAARDVRSLSDTGLYIYKDPNYRAPAPKAAPVSKPAPASGPTPFDKRLGTIKAKNKADTASLSKSIKTQKKQYAAAAASNKNDSIIESLQKQITGWNTKYNNLVTSNNDTVKSLKTDYRNTINSLKGGYDNQIKDLLAGFNTKYSELESNYKDTINNLKTGYDTNISNLRTGYDTNISNLKNNFENQIGNLNQRIESYQKSYNPTTAVGTSAKATSFEVPESTAGQLGIKNKGTSQFNRKVRNNLKITGVQL